MLVNYIKVFQQADVEAIVAQAGRSDNVTGVGGPVAGEQVRVTNGADETMRNEGWCRWPGGSMAVLGMGAIMLAEWTGWARG
jgi:hypothetical protein